MATILFTWELGAAMGHVTILRPIAEALARKGHRLFAAIRDVTQAKSLAPPGVLTCLQAPVRLSPVRDRIVPAANFAHALHNFGFGHREELQPLVDAWRALYDIVRPDLICCEFSPTALLASHASTVKRVVIGYGFTFPPDVHPLPSWRSRQRHDPLKLRQDELRVLGVMNEFLGSWNQPSLERVTQLYRRTDRQVLATFSELDHFGSRANEEYWGIWTNQWGQPPQWPAGPGKKVFAYLKPFKALPALLDFLRRIRLPTIIFGPTIDRDLQERNRSDTLSFVSDPVDLAAVGREADLAILNSTNGATSAMLLAGVPLLLLPLHNEQQMLANRVVQMGAGLIADRNDGSVTVSKLRKLLASESYGQAARAFAKKYSDHDAQRQIDRLVQQIEELLSN